MNKKRRALLTALIILFLLFRSFLSKTVTEWTGVDLKSPGLGATLLYQAVWYLLPMVCILPFFYPARTLLQELGLRENPLRGLVAAFIITLPMILAYPFIGNLPDPGSMGTTIGIALFAGFFEELFFRGFLFGQLFRRAGWGFIPAVLLPGVLFAAGHLYQSSDLGGAIAVFGITLMGAAWFSWLFAESKFDIWLIIFLHFFMNLSWGLFSIDHSAAGSVLANIPRILTIALSIGYIVIFVRRKGEFRIHRANLWIHKE